jgi:hypothetical protein
VDRDDSRVAASDRVGTQPRKLVTWKLVTWKLVI